MYGKSTRSPIPAQILLKIYYNIYIYIYIYLVLRTSARIHTSGIWSNHKNRGRRATQFILNDFDNISNYKTILLRCELLPLTLRSQLDLTLFFSILQDENCLCFEDFFIFQSASGARDHLTTATIQNQYIEHNAMRIIYLTEQAMDYGILYQ